jgi:hypothetical protein
MSFRFPSLTALVLAMFVWGVISGSSPVFAGGNELAQNGPQYAAQPPANPSSFDPSTFNWTDSNNWVEVKPPAGTGAAWWMDLRDPAAREYHEQVLKTGQYCYYPVSGWGSSRTLRIPTNSPACHQVEAFNPSTFNWIDPKNWESVPSWSTTYIIRLRDPAARAYSMQAIHTGHYCTYQTVGFGSHSGLWTRLRIPTEDVSKWGRLCKQSGT